MIWLILWGHLHASDPVHYMIVCFSYEIMMMVFDMMICYLIIYVLTSAIYGFLLSVNDTCRMGMPMASMDLLGLRDKSGSGLYMVWVFLLLHMWHMTGYIMILFIDHWHVSLMDAGSQFLTNQSHIWNKGVMHDNQRYWGRGVEKILPHPTSTLIVARTIG